MINQSLNLNFDRIEGEDRMKNLGMVACIRCVIRYVIRYTSLYKSLMIIEEM